MLNFDIEYYPNGRIRYQDMWIGGQKHGPSCGYHPNGFLYFKRKYVSGNIEGVTFLFHKDGSRSVITQKRVGVFNGSIIKFNYAN
jgi:antitoxin component YwqK of YwqJK toxin-antitoxin module